MVDMVFGNVAAERAAIEATYEGLCTVTEFQTTKDPVTKASRQQAVIVLLDQPCALSQVSLSAANLSDATNEISYDAKLFISPDVTINAGSWIRVVQDGMDYKFERAGEPFQYATHQEVKLKRIDRA